VKISSAAYHTRALIADVVTAVVVVVLCVAVIVVVVRQSTFTAYVNRHYKILLTINTFPFRFEIQLIRLMCTHWI